MLKKKRLKSRPVCKVTFEIPSDIEVQHANLVGDFNQWDVRATPMRKLKDGRYTVTLDLEPERVYQFRYLYDGNSWDNDWVADAYVPNPFGSENSVVRT